MGRKALKVDGSGFDGIFRVDAVLGDNPSAAVKGALFRPAARDAPHHSVKMGEQWCAVLFPRATFIDGCRDCFVQKICGFQSRSEVTKGMNTVCCICLEPQKLCFRKGIDGVPEECALVCQSFFFGRRPEVVFRPHISAVERFQANAQQAQRKLYHFSPWFAAAPLGRSGYCTVCTSLILGRIRAAKPVPRVFSVSSGISAITCVSCLSRSSRAFSSACFAMSSFNRASCSNGRPSCTV